MIDRNKLRTLDALFGTNIEDAGASGEEAPNNHNFAGAVSTIERLLEEMDDYGLSYSDLPEEKQTELDEALEDFRYNLKIAANEIPAMVGEDTEMELPNGNTVSLPGQATEARNSNAPQPADPRTKNNGNNGNS